MIDLSRASSELSTLIEVVPEDLLGSPTPCSEYCVGDLLDHIAGLTVAFGGAAVKGGGESADMGPQGSAANLPADWRESLPGRLAALARDWQDPDAWSGMTRVGGQEIPGEVAGTVCFGELVVHGWDLARATGMRWGPDPAGVTPLFDLVRRAFGPGQDAARGAAFGPAVPVATEAPVFDQILGLLGRDPQWTP